MGMTPPNPPPPPLFCLDIDGCQFQHSPPVPKIEFPKFDGDSPRLWCDHCETYFEVYAVISALKTRFATLNFQGVAKTWLQTIERRGRINDWEQFCAKVFERFDKDQYPKQLKQLDALKQTSSVEEYLKQFEKLVHGILLYNNAYDDVYFVTRFVAGLKPKLRTAIALHRPQDVATASTLALLQEEELNASHSKSFGWDFTKGNGKFAGLKQQEGEKTKQLSVTDDKLQELKQFRRKNGLCFKYGNKWNHNHQCPDQISLHVLEELLDALGTNSEEGGYASESQEVEETMMALNSSQPVQSTKRKTFKLLANVGNQKVLILVDSGSVGTFISDALVQQLRLKTEDCPPLQYKDADGGILNCSQKVSKLQWFIQGITFTSSPQVLQLKCFDMILGEDWLEEVSPIWVDYKQKVLKVTYQGKRVTLKGAQESGSPLRLYFCLSFKIERSAQDWHAISLHLHTAV